MFAISDNGTSIVNMDSVACMYISDRNAIKVVHMNGSGCQIASYNTQQEAEEALIMLAESIGKKDAFFFPNDETVQMRIRAQGQKYHHMTGKKTKGHGGS